MAIWTSEIKELERLYESLKGQLPDLEKELVQLIHTTDANVIMLYSRRCLEVIIADLCECELKRPRQTEPLKGIIDKLHKEGKVPAHIITSMHGLNDLSNYGAHPKDFDPEQVKPVLSNLSIIIRWYLKYKESQTTVKVEGKKPVSKYAKASSRITGKKRNILILSFFALLITVAAIVALIKLNIINIGKQSADLMNIEKSIAILPFKNDSPDTTNVYFINGVMEDILNNLQRIKDLRVISRTSVEQYRNQTKPIPEIAKELGVNYILEGSGQKSGNKIHLSVQLLRAAKEGHLWGNSYEQEIHFAAEIFDIQRQISEAIATELKAVITPWEKIIIEKIPTKDLDAYDAYLKGQFYWGKLTQNDLETAMKYFELAKEKDPEYALAYAGISDTWIGLAQMGYVAPIEAGAKAQSALIKATELDTTLAQVHYSLALLKYASEWDWGSSELEFQKVFAINPNHAEAHAYYSHLLNIVGRPKEALEQIDIALKLDPFNPLIKAMYGIDLLFLRRYNDAIAISRDALKTDPTNPVALAASTYAFDKTDNYKEALRTGELAYKVIYPAAIHAFSQGNGSTKESYLKTWKRESDALAKQSINLFFNPTDIAYGYIIAGEKNKALEWLEQAYEVRDQNLMYVLLPCYDNLRNEPGFQKLCLKMNLPYK